MSAYCQIANVYEWIPRGSISAQALLVAAVNATTNILTINGHGLALDDELTFRAEAGGSLPGGLVEGTTYYAIPLTDSTFQVATSAGGSAVNLTTAGENVVAVVELPWARWIASASAEIESTIPAHAVPLTAPYPEVVTSYTAGLVASKALAFCGTTSASIDARLALVRNELREWRAKGIPVRGAVVPTSANLAVRATATAVDSRGWCNSSGDGYLP